MNEVPTLVEHLKNLAQGYHDAHLALQEQYREMKSPEELLLRQMGQDRRQHLDEPLFHLAELVQQNRSDPCLGGRDSASHELGKAPVSGLVVAHHQQRRADQGAENAFEIRLALCRFQASIEQRQPLSIEGLEPSGEDGPHQTLFGAEVVVHRGDVGAGLPGDGAERRAGDAVLGKEPLRGLEELGLGVGRGRDRHLNECLNQTIV